MDWNRVIIQKELSLHWPLEHCFFWDKSSNFYELFGAVSDEVEFEMKNLHGVEDALSFEATLYEHPFHLIQGVKALTEAPQAFKLIASVRFLRQALMH